MKKHTIKWPINLRGPSLFCPLKISKVYLLPSDQEGIWFSNGHERLKYDLEAVKANQARNGARYLKISTKDPIRVPEHLLSAIFWAGITDIEIRCPDKELPAYGPGICKLYERLMDFRVQKGGEELSPVKVVRKAEFVYKQKGLEGKITAEPSDKLDIFVLSGKYPDLIDLGEKPFELQDAPSKAARYVDARAIARLMDLKKYLAWKVLRFFGYEGITNFNYILTKPSDKAEDIRDRMFGRYEADGNEHLAHTAVCDFPGELLAVGSYIQGRFTLSNTNHLARVAAIKEFFSQGVFQNQER